SAVARPYRLGGDAAGAHENGPRGENAARAVCPCSSPSVARGRVSVTAARPRGLRAVRGRGRPRTGRRGARRLVLGRPRARGLLIRGPRAPRLVVRGLPAVRGARRVRGLRGGRDRRVGAVLPLVAISGT